MFCFGLFVPFFSFCYFSFFLFGQQWSNKKDRKKPFFFLFSSLLLAFLFDFFLCMSSPCEIFLSLFFSFAWLFFFFSCFSSEMFFELSLFIGRVNDDDCSGRNGELMMI